MAPKNKGKKGKKGDDDDDDAYWESKAAALDLKSPAPGKEEEEDDVPASKRAATKSMYDLLDEEDDEEGGGLMATINASSNKKKDKKSKKKKGAVEEDEEPADNGDIEPIPPTSTAVNMEDEWPEEDVKPKKGKKGKQAKKAVEEDEDEIPTPAAPIEMDAPPPETAVKLDDEWPEEDVQSKKGKKGKKGKAQKVDEDEDDWFVKAEEKKEEVAVPVVPTQETSVPAEVPTGEEEEDGDGELDDGEPKILTKAQKEKLKKEKEKAKKKAQAAAKKAPATTAAAEIPEPESTPAPPADEDEDEGEDDGAGGGDKKKKKKKKAPAKAPEPAAPAKGKKQSAHIAAMQAAMLEKQRIEEQARRVEAERIRKIEEEDARIAAEEQRIADEKAVKKAKEKEKLARAKAEGRLLTPAQKRERAAAEARKQAMLDAGMKVAGLQEGAGEKKKAGFAKKRPGKGPVKKEETPASPSVQESAPASPVVAAAEPAKVELVKEAEVDGDDWDKSEDDEAAVETVVAGVNGMKVNDGDDWDQSDDEEPVVEVKSNTVPAPVIKGGTPAPVTTNGTTPAANGKTAVANGKPAPVANGKPAAKTNGKVAAAEESSSEEETSSEDDSDDETDSDESSEDEAEVRRARARTKIEARQQVAEAAKDKNDLRSPICCILGHVDTGKTKLLDKIRQTNVQEGEAGGITQQIGATFFPKSAIEEKTAVVNKDHAIQVQVPGLLIIDTPGHESFTNLRTRGSSLCNIAILVVDITHGLEPQTIESLNLLRNGKTPFIVALNKIDRMYGWKSTPNGGFRESLAQQPKSVISEFEDRVKKTKLAFSEQGLNAEIFDENKNLARNVSLVPTSAITGEGIPDMLMLLVKLTQERMNQSLMFISELECTILEVKVVEGLGTTVDVILSNGVMREGDKIVLCGQDGPIVTNVRALLAPQPLRELRVKSASVHHKEVRAAQGIKISAPGLEKAIAGARLYVAQDEDEEEYYKELAMKDITDLRRFAVKDKEPGVWVQASTIGSLEALLTFLQQMKIPVRNFGIGPVFKSQVLRASRMLETASEYAVILCFDVNVDKDAEQYAKDTGVRIFSAMIIYHLFDAFTKYMAEVTEAKKQAAMPHAVWPVKMKIIKAFAHRDPIVLGVDISDGNAIRTGTPVGVVKVDKETGKRDIIVLGKITGIEINHKPFELVKRAQIGAGAAVKIERASYQAARAYGRHFDDKDEVVSLITRQSIDTLKTNFRDQVELSDWALIKKMKIEQGVQ